MTPDDSHPLSWIDDELADLDVHGLLRTRGTHTGAQQPQLEIAGQQLINFGSNDYLGLAADPRLASAAVDATLQFGAGAGASPLVTGYSTLHEQLELRLAQFEGTQRALLFSSGYAANQGTIPALVERGDAIFADQKNHASMIDGCRLSRADIHIYPHRDTGALAELLTRQSGARRRLIATESVFSMDGDLAPLVELADLAERFNCMLLVDEAHATGVFGERGRGLAEEQGVEDRVHVRIGTLSKALGCAGGFVSGSASLVDWLLNRARPYIFSTALPPATCAAALAALDIVRDEPERRQQLAERAQLVRQRLAELGWQLGTSASQIIPLVVGPADRATQLAGELRKRGLLVPAIRPPSVAPGESLLRISLTCGHTEPMLDELCEALAELRVQPASA